jgi:glycosyltransferase involved in cell wall biosynthesis
MPSCAFVVPGQLDTISGGYGYDRRIVSGLRGRGWSVDVRALGGGFPHPTPTVLAQARQELSQIETGAIVVVDGLALGAMPDEVEQEAERLRLVALVHHPLAMESGLRTEEKARLETTERRALAFARLVVVTSRRTAADLYAYDVPPERVVVVEPGTDPAPLARGSNGPRVECLCVGALIPRKGHDMLINALADVPRRDWHLTCAGSTDRHPATVERLQQLLKSTGLGNHVRFTGEIDEQTLMRLYGGADVFVLATLHEGYGMAVAEALAHGLPVIATDTGGIADLLSPGAGVVVRPGDVQALSDALNHVIGDRGVRQRLTSGARVARDRLRRWDAAAAEMAHALEPVAHDHLQR